jgi:hypothetical protein
LGLKSTASIIGNRPPNRRSGRKWLTWKRGLVFLAVWTLVLGEIVLYGDQVPGTLEGWAALIVLGLVGCIALAAVLDWLFGNDRPAV